MGGTGWSSIRAWAGGALECAQDGCYARLRWGGPSAPPAWTDGRPLQGRMCWGQMRIVIFQDTYHPTCNGVVISTDLFIKGLRARGHDVLLVVPHLPGTPVPTDPSVIVVEAIDTNSIYPNSCLGKFWTTDLGPRLRAFNPDVVHSMTEFTIGHVLASLWAWRLRRPRVHTFHTQWTEYLFYFHVIPLFMARPLLRLVFRTAVRLFGDAIIAPSDGFARLLRDDWGIRSHPVDVVPTGIELAQFAQGRRESFRARYKIADDERVVLYLGRLGTEKNVELCLRTMAELRRRGEPKLRFVIAGGGPPQYVESLKALAVAGGVTDTVWTGFIHGQDWLDCYRAADVTLFPSVTETQGLVVLESLAAGVPLVSVEAIGPASTMRGERGCLFAAATPEDFADKTQRLLNDPVLYARKVAEARELAQSHSLEQRAAELENIYVRTVTAHARHQQLPAAASATPAPNAQRDPE